MSKITITNLTHAYKYEEVLENININFPDKGFIGLIGYSGSGKSTLLNIIGGLINPLDGEVYINDTNLYGVKKEEQRKLILDNISYTTQGNSLFPNLNAIENIKLALDIKNSSIDQERLAYFASRLKITKLLDKPVVNLSGGERKRVQILRDILNEKSVYLLDEPTSSLDEESSLIIWDIIKEISNDKLVIVSSHEVNFLESYANGIIDLDSEEIAIQMNEPKVMDNKINYSNEKLSLSAPQKRNRYKINITYIIILSILFTLLSIYIGYRVEETYWADVNITYYSDTSKKGITNLKIFDNDKEKLQILINDNQNIKFYEVYSYAPYSILNQHLNDTSIQSTHTYFIKYEEQYEIIEGRSPASIDEILITKMQFDLFKVYGFKDINNIRIDINDFSDLNGKLIKPLQRDNHYVIVGVVDTKINDAIDYITLQSSIPKVHLYNSEHSSLYIYEHDESMEILDAYFIDLSDLNFTEMLKFYKQLDKLDLYFKTDYTILWSDEVKNVLNSTFGNKKAIEEAIIVIYIVFMTLISVLFIQNSLVKMKRENVILIFLGKPRRKVAFENIVSYLVNLVSVVSLSYIMIFLLIKIINIDLEGRYKMIMNIFHGNYQFMYIPILSILILFVSIVIHVFIYVYSLKVIKNIE